MKFSNIYQLLRISVLAYIFVISPFLYAENSSIRNNSEDNNISIRLKSSSFCVLIDDPTSTEYAKKIIDDISKELVFYDYILSPVKTDRFIIKSDERIRVKAFIDFSDNRPIYIPKPIYHEFTEVLDYKSKECIFVNQRLKNAFDKKTLELKNYKNEINQAEIFINKINGLINSKHLRDDEVGGITFSIDDPHLISEYTNSFIEELRSLGNIELKSPSLFNISEYKGKHTENPKLIASIYIVDKESGKLVDRLIVLYINNKWKLAMPTI